MSTPPGAAAGAPGAAGAATPALAAVQPGPNGGAVASYLSFLDGFDASIHVPFLAAKVLEATPGVPCADLSDATLLYRSSVHGLSRPDFCERVGGRGRNLVILRLVEGGTTCLFGGFSCVGFSGEQVQPGEHEWVPDETAFLFSLVGPHGLPPTAYRVKPDCPALSNDRDAILRFGIGSAIAVHDNGRVWCGALPSSYTDATGFDRETFTGLRHMSTGALTELLVFAV